MATPKLDRSHAARLFHALSDETRLAVLERLRDGEECVCDLQDSLDAAQSRLSFHLKVLKEAGLVTDRREGRWVHYSASREKIDEIAELLARLKPARRRLVIRSADGCCG
jgi:ArsR family transcriptional regulator, arsenate/arsenite/antimonite-responsive transcriptional repressor